MSDPRPTDPTDPPAPPASTDPAATGQPTDPPAAPSDSDALGDTGKKALEREREARRAAEKAAAEAQRRIKEFEDRDKSEAEKAAERAKAADERAAKAELELARTQVAMTKGLTEAQAKRLVGSTREELEADADELLKDFPVGTPDPAGPRRPAPDPSQGHKRNPPNLDTLIAEAQAKGDVQEVIRLQNRKLYNAAGVQ